jgi:hypothetical protein
VAVRPCSGATDPATLPTGSKVEGVYDRRIPPEVRSAAAGKNQSSTFPGEGARDGCSDRRRPVWLRHRLRGS